MSVEMIFFIAFGVIILLQIAGRIMRGGRRTRRHAGGDWGDSGGDWSDGGWGDSDCGGDSGGDSGGGDCGGGD
ncbi:MAG TPA: hypothetical protein VGE07_00405 [Herpetosiphonaceae bacterium]